ncbi:MAG: cytochrome c [Nitratireductor sp.]|uniref:cytochrome c n=1 Tax=Nitratireductor sp. TaxID=1872084 RepID=UPI00261926E7|nr:cytochrome c [Nitratireductor sp.]MCV0351000.1 cytochrome c [Nitratireductor sp.]
MKTFLRILAGLVVVGVIALLAFVFVPVKRSAPTQNLAADWQPEEGQGQYVMYAGDCVACHTAEGGEPLAGGRPIESPMGTIWSTNITPDPKTGIGGWSLDDFRAAMVDGLMPDGTHLYPAMPYENFRFMSEADIRALYNYLMNGVEPVENRVQATQLAFPFNQRWGLRAWNWMALSHEAGFKPLGASDMQDRGQYLVEGAGHCAACHSPRNDLMMQDGVTASQKTFLAGGVIDGWEAPALYGPNSTIAGWSVEETANYLATGRNAHSAANGEMALVVEHSLQHLTDADNLAIAAFLKGKDAETTEVAGVMKAMPQPEADAAGEETAAMLTEASPDMPLGPRLYLDNCSGCHFVTGKGAPEIFPELENNPMVVSAEVGPLISVILNGAEVPSTEKRPMKLVMQGYAERLDDAEVAELVNFLRSSWGNDAAAISAEDVAKVRAAQSTH